MTKAIQNPIIKQYCKQVKKHLPFSLRKRLLDTLQSDLEDFLETNPTATEEQIKQQFGKPEEFSKAFLNALESKERAKARRLHYSAIIALIVAIAVSIFLCSAAIYIAIESRPQPTYYYEEITYG